MRVAVRASSPGRLSGASGESSGRSVMLSSDDALTVSGEALGRSYAALAMAVLMRWTVATPTFIFRAVWLMLVPPFRSRSIFCFLR